jgi:hypothetical protein
MISTRRQPLLWRVPSWLIILTMLMTASVIAERVQGATGSSNAGGTEYHPRISRLMTGRAVAFALTFDQIVSHSASQYASRRLEPGIPSPGCAIALSSLAVSARRYRYPVAQTTDGALAAWQSAVRTSARRDASNLTRGQDEHGRIT